MVGTILVNKETILGLQPENAVQHGVRRARFERLWARAGPAHPASRHDTSRIPVGYGPAQRTRWFFPRPFHGYAHRDLSDRQTKHPPGLRALPRLPSRRPGAAIGLPTPRFEARLQRPAPT